MIRRGTIKKREREREQTKHELGPSLKRVGENLTCDGRACDRFIRGLGPTYVKTLGRSSEESETSNDSGERGHRQAVGARALDLVRTGIGHNSFKTRAAGL